MHVMDWSYISPQRRCNVIVTAAETTYRLHQLWRTQHRRLKMRGAMWQRPHRMTVKLIRLGLQQRDCYLHSESSSAALELSACSATCLSSSFLLSSSRSPTRYHQDQTYFCRPLRAVDFTTVKNNVFKYFVICLYDAYITYTNGLDICMSFQTLIVVTSSECRLS